MSAYKLWQRIKAANNRKNMEKTTSLELRKLTPNGLSNVDLSGLNLSKLNLNTFLPDRRILGAWFNNCTMIKCDLRSAHISKSEFRETILRQAEFTDCMIDMSDFYRASLVDTAFSNCSIKNTSFLNCDLRHTNFYYAVLSHVDFRGANLEGAVALNAVFVHCFFDPCWLIKDGVFTRHDYD